MLNKILNGQFILWITDKTYTKLKGKKDTGNVTPKWLFHRSIVDVLIRGTALTFTSLQIGCIFIQNHYSDWRERDQVGAGGLLGSLCGAS